MRLAVVLLVSTALVTPARAGSADDEQRARGHYEIGLGLYRLGDYHAALKEFAAGYELARKPGFLLNLGQTYRKLGELRDARDMYRQFLAESQKDDPARPEARKVLAEIEQAIRKQPPEPRFAPRAASSASATPTPPAARTPAAAPTATTTPATGAAAPTPPAAAAEPTSAAGPSDIAPTPATPPTASVTLQRASPPPRPRRGLRIAGIALGVAGVALIGGGIGTTVAANGIAADLNAADHSGGIFDPSKDRAYTVDRALSIGLFAAGGAVVVAGTIALILSAR